MILLNISLRFSGDIPWCSLNKKAAPIAQGAAYE
jgi:hypothetical protein